jgi:hypothetical protein
MIKNEAEIRIALQAVLVTVLALTGYWGCAMVVMLIMLPWRPIFAVGCYLVQPLVDWRIQKARVRQEKGLGHIERELDSILRAPNAPPGPTMPDLAHTAIASAAPPQHGLPRPLESFKPRLAAGPPFQNLPESAQDLAAASAIPSAINHHVRNLPQGVFTNMDLEVEEVKFHGETADAYVRFESSNVAGLVIRQRYALRKSGEHWKVESRQPANGGSKAPPPYQPMSREPMRLS